MSAVKSSPSPEDYDSAGSTEVSIKDELGDGSSVENNEELAPSKGPSYNKPVFTLKDELLYCCDCSAEYSGDCLEHGPLTVVNDSPVSTSQVRTKEKDLRAAFTAPALVVLEDEGVTAREEIPARTRFGPLEGKKVPLDEATPNFSWLVRKAGKGDHCIDASDPSISNWMRYVNTALQFGQHNMRAIQYRGNIFFTTTRPIEPEEELFVWSEDKTGNTEGQGKAMDIADILETTIWESTSNLKNEADEEQYNCQVPDGNFICDVCEKQFLRLENLSEHMKSGCEINSSPGSSKKSHQNVCGKEEFIISKCHEQSPNSVNANQPNISEGQRSASSHCNELDQNRDLNLRLRSDSDGSVYVCSECGKRFNHKDNLVRHLRTHTGEKPFICAECGKQFAQKVHLAKHLPTHTGEKPFACEECGKQFAQKIHLTNHLICHSGEKPFACSECGKQFSDRGNLTRHVRAHSGEKPFSCTECGKQFSQKTHLTKHLNSHSGEKPFACTDCGKRFSDRSNLTRHLLAHSGEKPFACEECGKQFTQKTHLTNHLSTHSGEKPFSCSECDKQFVHKYLLAHHFRTHTQEKPYGCPECGRHFARKDRLVLHQRIHSHSLNSTEEIF